MSDVMIEAKGLSKSYGPVHALKDVSFEVHKGEVLGFLGPNGAGKTTTMKILTCFIAPTTGSAKLNGCDIFDDPMGVRRSLGYLPEATPLYGEMRVLEYLEFVAKMRGFKGPEIHKRIKRAVEQTSLGDYISRDIRDLSKGLKQRVGISQALVHEPPVLILDEPMSGLDPNQASEIRNLITEIGRERTVILSTHDLAEVENTCDRVLIISSGSLVADDSPEELRQRAGAASYFVTLQGEEAEAKRAQELFKKINGVANVRIKGHEEEGEQLLHLSPEKDLDLRADIFRASVDGSLTLLGLERRAEGLDKVFRDLTTGAEAPKGSSRDAKKEEARRKKAERDAAKAEKEA